MRKWSDVGLVASHVCRWSSATGALASIVRKFCRSPTCHSRWILPNGPEVASKLSRPPTFVLAWRTEDQLADSPASARHSARSRRVVDVSGWSGPSTRTMSVSRPA